MICIKTATTWLGGRLVGGALASPKFWQNNQIFLAKDFSLLLSSSLSSFKQTRRKNLRENRQNMSGRGSSAKKEEIERHEYTLRLTQ